MSPFVTFRDTDKAGVMQYYILQRAYPHFLGVITYYPTGETIYQTPVAGHHLYVTFNGVLRGNFLPAHQGVETEIQVVFEAMALWFYSERIMKDPKKYKKFMIHS